MEAGSERGEGNKGKRFEAKSGREELSLHPTGARVMPDKE